MPPITSDREKPSQAGDSASAAPSEPRNARLRPGPGVLAHSLQTTQPNAGVGPHVHPGRRDVIHRAISLVSKRVKARCSGSLRAIPPADEPRLAPVRRQSPLAAGLFFCVPSRSESNPVRAIGSNPRLRRNIRSALRCADRLRPVIDSVTIVSSPFAAFASVPNLADAKSALADVLRPTSRASRCRGVAI
jgi:hypothetical protein